MGQLFAIAFGGSVGAVLRFLVANGIYHWFGRGFPYGTLAVNVIGSMLMGLLTETLFFQKIALALEFRAAILVGFFGAFTTFSTFALDTVTLLEQGQITKAFLNIFISVTACLLALWLGLLLGRAIGWVGAWMSQRSGIEFPYTLALINLLGAFLLGFIMVVLINKVLPSLEYRAAFSLILTGLYITISTLYVVLALIEQRYSFEANLQIMVVFLSVNTLLCLGSIWLGILAGERV